MDGVELVDAEEQPDAACELVADGAALLLAVGSGEQQPGRRAGRSHHHPALRPTVVGERRRVLDRLETEPVGEEPDGGADDLLDPEIVVFFLAIGHPSRPGRPAHRRVYIGVAARLLTDR